MLSIPLLIAAVGLYFWLTSGGSVSTDNAAVKQDIVVGQRPGQRPGGRRWLVQEQRKVKRGDLLFRIDPAPFQRRARSRPKAQLAAARLQTSQLQDPGRGYRRRYRRRCRPIWRSSAARSAASRRCSSAASRPAPTMTMRSTRCARPRPSWPTPAPGPPMPARRWRPASSRRSPRPRRRSTRPGSTCRAPRSARRSTASIANADRLQVGQMAVARASPCCRSSRDNQAWVEANFKEGDLGRMAPASAPKIEIDAYPGASSSTAMSQASAPARAANSRSFRRRMPTATGSR